MVYTAALDAELAASVRGFMRHFTVAEGDEYCKGKIAADEAGNPKPTAEGTDYEGWGFCVEVPQKMRLLSRLLRESWQFGGCGLQLDELTKQGKFLTNYLPLHNDSYQQAYSLDTWGSLTSLTSCCFTCCTDNELSLIHYFGESVAIYFTWMRQYTQQLVLPALIGIACGIMEEADFYPALVGACFAIFMVVWGVFWIRKWQRAEVRFAIKWGQHVEAASELVRDEYTYTSKRLIDVRSIYTLDFEYPMTMQKLPDGTMVELAFPASKRNFRRYCISYPLLALFAAAMVAALFFTEYYRFEHQDSNQVAIGASIVSTLITAIFSKLSAILIVLLNDYENCRTDSEYDDESTLKSFAFLFVSTYFSVFTIGVWPGVPSSVRIGQLKAQMVTQQVVMPFVGNIIELVVPKLVTSLKRRADTLGGYCTAICSYLCCCNCCCMCESCDYGAKKAVAPTNEREEQGHEIWKQAQRAPYVSTNADYCEVALQYGYALMFAAVFPWAGLAALANNVIESRVDAFKLLKEYQRPMARTAITIGAWNDIFWILSGLAIVTNTYFITIISHAPKEAKMAQNEAALMRDFAFLQYFLVLAVLVLGVIRGTQSPTARKAAIKTSLLQDRAIQEFVKRQLAMTPEELAASYDSANAAIAATEEQTRCCPC